MFRRGFAFLALSVLIFSKQGFADDADSVQSKKQFLPSTAHFQFAGFVGMFSVGFGYHYAKGNMNTSLFYGYVPSAYAIRPIHTVALKQTFNLYNINRAFSFRLPVQPILYTGFTVNCEVSKHSYITLPDYYPSGYYSSQAVHATLFTGLRLHIPISNGPVKKAIEPFVESGTLDTYLWYHISGEINDADDIFRLALGINYFFR